MTALSFIFVGLLSSAAVSAYPVSDESSIELPKPGICGISLADRIRGGKKTALHAYPWTTLLGKREASGDIEFFCGGSLILDQFVLTAAHCLHKIVPDKDKFFIRLGEWDTASDEDCLENICSDKPIDFDIEIYLLHEDVIIDDDFAHNDIALIKLSHRVTFTEFISPVCLPLSKELQSQPENGKIFTAIGWGRTKNGGDNSRFKLEVDISGIARETCMKTFSNVWQSEFCAENSTEKQTCRGDSGGPLVAEHDGNWFQYGIVSYGSECGVEPYGVYVRVSSFLPWIMENMKKLMNVSDSGSNIVENK